MHNYILENDPSEEFLPKELKQILETRFTENRIYIFSAYKEMKRTPYAFVDKLRTGDSIIGQTNYHNEDQIERLFKLLIELMMKGVAINVYIFLIEEKFSNLEEAFNAYLRLPYAFNQDTACKPEKYKAMLNDNIEKATAFHCMYRIYNGNPMVDKRVLSRVMTAAS